MNRTQRRLLVLLGAQLLVLAIIHNPFSRAAAGGPKPVLPALAAYSPQKIEITSGEGATVTLVHRAESWTLAEPPGYPTEPGKVEKLAQQLVHLTAGRPVASDKSSYGALRVADDRFERRARIWTKPEASPTATFYLGSPAGSGGSHVRVAGSNEVVEAAGITPFDMQADPAAWIDRKLVPIEASQVTRFDVANKKGAFSLARAGGAWRVQAPAARAGAALDSTKVFELAQALCSVSIVEPVGPVDERGQGLSPPAATVTLGGADPGAPASAYRIGGLVPGKTDSYYGTRAGSGYTVILSKYEVDRALTVTLQDLIKK